MSVYWSTDFDFIHYCKVVGDGSEELGCLVVFLSCNSGILCLLIGNLLLFLYLHELILLFLDLSLCNFVLHFVLLFRLLGHCDVLCNNFLLLLLNVNLLLSLLLELLEQNLLLHFLFHFNFFLSFILLFHDGLNSFVNKILLFLVLCLIVLLLLLLELGDFVIQVLVSLGELYLVLNHNNDVCMVLMLKFVESWLD